MIVPTCDTLDDGNKCCCISVADTLPLDRLRRAAGAIESTNMCFTYVGFWIYLAFYAATLLWAF